MVKKEEKGNKTKTQVGFVGLIISIIAITFASTEILGIFSLYLPLFGIVFVFVIVALPIISLTLSIIQQRKKPTKYGKAGIIISIISLILIFLIILIGIQLMQFAGTQI